MSCEDELKQYWQQHDLEAAKTQLQSSYVWLQKYGGTSVPFSDSMLTCSYLKSFYEFKAGHQPLNLNYEQLLNFWLQDHITAVKAVEGLITDEQEYIAYLKSKSTLEKFFDTITSPFSVSMLLTGAVIVGIFLLLTEFKK